MVISFSTSVWGAGWETKSKREELSDRYFEKMKEFSKARMAKSDFDKQLHYTDKYMN